MKKILFVLSCIILGFGAQAQDGKYGIKPGTEPKGVPVGEKAAFITTETIDGEAFDLYEAIKEKPVILLFYRGEWCPVCMRYLSNVSDSITLLTAKATVYAISLEKAEFTQVLKNKLADDITFLKDTDGEISKRYKLVFDVTDEYQKMFKGYVKTEIENRNANGKAQLPVPATYVIGTNGKIIYRQFDYNYSNRASVADILKALD